MRPALAEARMATALPSLGNPNRAAEAPDLRVDQRSIVYTGDTGYSNDFAKIGKRFFLDHGFSVIGESAEIGDDGLYEADQHDRGARGHRRVPVRAAPLLRVRRAQRARPPRERARR